MPSLGDRKERLVRFARLAGRMLVPLGILLALLINLGGQPPLWWDEGWTLTVARNWVERGFYGRLLVGEPIPAGLQAGLPTTGLVALSFRLFGVGAWQGRLVGVVTMAGALALLYYLAGRLYNRQIARGMLAILLLLPVHYELHPLLMGRQVLAEPPMLLYLLAGYALLWGALHRSAWLTPLVALPWGIALAAKMQALPFWAASIVIPLAFLLWKRHWKGAGILGGAAAGALVVYGLFPLLQTAILGSGAIRRGPVEGLYSVTALVPDLFLRLRVLTYDLVAGLPVLLGLLYAARRWLKDADAADRDRETVRLALLSFVGSWFAWHMLFSAGWLRYLFPATFVGSLFAAVWLYEVTDRYNLRTTLQRAVQALRTERFRGPWASLCAVLILVIYLPLGLFSGARLFRPPDHTALQVAEFLHANTPPDALIELYDTEVMFFLQRPYHFPHDEVAVEMIYRSTFEVEMPLSYDPLAADPDYLVVGPFIRYWELYDATLAAGAFRPIRQIGRSYIVYERVR